MSTESKILLSKLKSFDPGIYESLNLHFSPILEPGANINTVDVLSFKSFLTDCFQILGTVLVQRQKYKHSTSIRNELFRVYRLCLRSLDAILPKLVDFEENWLIHQVQFIKCLEAHTLNNNVEKYGLILIGKVEGNQVIRAKSHCKVLELYESLFNIDQKSTTSDDQYCRMLLGFMKKAIAWHRLDCQGCEKFRVKLASILRKYAYRMLTNTSLSDINSRNTLCVTVLNEYKRSPILKEYVYKVANIMCSCLFKLPKNNHLYVTDILDCIAPEVEEGNNGVEFVNTVKECASECIELEITDFCAEFARYLIQKGDIYQKAASPLNSLLRIIAARLTIVSSKKTKFEDLVQVLVERHEILLKTPLLLNVYQQLEGQSSTHATSDFELSKTYLSPSIDVLHLLCQVLSKAYQSSGWTNTSATTQKEKSMLLTIMNMFHDLCRLLHISLRFPSEENENEKILLVKVVRLSFSFSIGTNLKFQETKNMIKKISLSKWIGKQQINQIVNFLEKVEDGKSRKDIEVLSLPCEVLWLFLKSHAEILSKDDLEKLARDTYSRSESLLKFLYDADYSKIEDKTVEFLKDWYIVKDMVDNLPSPVLVVKTWVKWRCEYNCRKDDNDSVDSILKKVMQSFTKVSKRIIGILLEQEYKAYVEMANKRNFTPFCEKMKLKIIALYMDEQIFFDAPKVFSQKAQTDQQLPRRKINEATSYLENAIGIMEEISKDERASSEVNPINHHLYLGYGLLHLCKPKANPYLKKKVEDINGLFESIMILLYNIFDFIQLKGFTVNSTDAYKLVIKMHKLINVSFDKQITVLWESRRLSHPTCISPLDWVFIKKLLDESKGENNETCRDSFKNKSGFHQNFYYLFENSHTHVEDRRKFFQSNTSYDDDMKIIDLATQDPIKRHSTFIAGYLYLDLCQSHIANGKLMQALLLAKEGHRLHSKLFKSTFDVNFTTNSIWEMIISVAGDVLPYNPSSEDFDKTYISPWKILQCYLDSTLEVGKIYEMIGDTTEAVAYLKLGKEIASSVNLPLFVWAFASILGKVYSQQPKNLKLANYEIRVAVKLFNDNKKFICQKCKLIMQATLEEYRGDLCQIKSEEGVVNFYETGLEKLLHSEWKNHTSCPRYPKPVSIKCSCSLGKKRNDEKKKANTKSGSLSIHGSGSSMAHANRQEIDCTTYSSCSPECILSNKGCWYCLPSKVGKTGLLQDLIDLKWEFVRRKMCMKLLSRSGKNLARSNQKAEARENVLKRISILVGSNPFCYTFSSINPKHFRDLVEMWSTDDIFSIERAEIVYDTCWFFLNGYSEIFSNPSSINLEEIATWLIRAFLRSWDVPIILQEVSKLLTVMCQISSESKKYSTCFGNALNEKSRAFFFHQTSIGTHLSCQFILNFKGPNFDVSSYTEDKTFMSLRLPEKIIDLEENMTKFLDTLPCTTIMCMSFLDHKYKDILEIFLSRSSVAWMLVSRRNVETKPDVILLPLQPIAQGSQTSHYEKTTKDWECPWGNDIFVDDIVPFFRTISQQYYYMLQQILSTENLDLLKDEAATFDKSLHTLLRSIEDMLFASSKDLLLENTSDHFILILDYDVQMIPWESMSMLRSQEVYRMPSITSISIVLDKFASCKEQIEGNLGFFPSIDPKCGYFVLNPDGSLPGFQKKFQKYLIDKKLKGTAGSKPTVTELVKVLEEHDLYLYFGLKSGSQYIDDGRVQQLEKCSVAFLMGCSSGCLTRQGSYAPIGTPLSYLMAGSPLIVSNLWIMLQSELILLGKSLLKDMLEPTNKTDIRRIGAFVAQARGKCIRPSISGASLVCYGVPVGIKRPETNGDCD